MGDATDIFHELGDPTRLRVLFSIIRGRKNVSTIVSELGLSQPQVSYHLRKLKDAGLATEEKDGRWVWYEANHGSDDARLRELLDLMARWGGVVGDSGAKAKSAGARAKATGARASRESERPRVERPKKPTRDMDDFLL